MQQAENQGFIPYSLPLQRVSSASVGVLDDHPDTQAPSEQDASQPPNPPYEPGHFPPAPAKRPGPARKIAIAALILALLFGIGLFAGRAVASNTSNNSSAATTSQTTTTTSTTQSSASTNSLETQQEAAIAKIEPSVVELQVTTAQGEQVGSGVIIDAKGDIVTNNHVVNGEQTIVAVLSNGSTETAQLIGTDASDDLAVVRIQPLAHMTVAQIGDSSRLVVGQEVMAVGNPLGITETATRGIVSALNRSVTESTGTTITHAIQTDAAVNPGNSGGALINLQGQLIGIPTLTAVNTESNTAANGLSFAIPANLVVAAVHQMLQQ